MYTMISECKSFLFMSIANDTKSATGKELNKAGEAIQATKDNVNRTANEAASLAETTKAAATNILEQTKTAANDALQQTAKNAEQALDQKLQEAEKVGITHKECKRVVQMFLIKN